MTNAQSVMRNIKAHLKNSEHRIREHRYLAILESGQVSKEAWRAFLGYQYHMWRTLVRSAAQFVQRFDGPAHQIAWAARMIQSYAAKFWDAMAAAA